VPFLQTRPFAMGALPWFQATFSALCFTTGSDNQIIQDQPPGDAEHGQYGHQLQKRQATAMHKVFQTASSWRVRRLSNSLPTKTTNSAPTISSTYFTIVLGSPN